MRRAGSAIAQVVRVLLGLGSNLGDRRHTLREAVAAIPGLVCVSPVYETEPVGGPDDQGAFLNLVVEVDSDLEPGELLDLCHRLEVDAGRVRRERWGPRILDVDILWIEGLTVAEADLVVPHPRMSERRFVMAPLADVAPDVAPAGWEQRAKGVVLRLGPL